MSWSAPQTWTTDQVVDAADLNTDIRDNINYLYTQVAAQFVLSAQGNPSTTLGCDGPLQIEFGTYDVDYVSAAFENAATYVFMQWTTLLPDDYGGGTITAIFHWYSPDGGTDAIAIGLQASAYGDGDDLDKAWGMAPTHPIQ